MACNLVAGEKPVAWGGSSKRGFLEFPDPVIAEVGEALGVAQFGGKHVAAKPRNGLGAGIFEIVEEIDGDTYRAIYAVRFREIVYVLYAFQKKSPKGIRTARGDVELVEKRLKIARGDYELRRGKEK